QIQGVEAIAVASNPPVGGANGRSLKLLDRDIADANNKLPNVNMLIIAPGYFNGLGVNVVRGRDFTETDGAPGGEVAIVNESFARKYWPNEDVIGKQIRLGEKDDAPWIKIVGVSPRILQTPGGPG